MSKKIEPKQCRHRKQCHLADNGSMSGGCIRYCPECGAISVTMFNCDRKWVRPGAEALKEFYDEEVTT